MCRPAFHHPYLVEPRVLSSVFEKEKNKNYKNKKKTNITYNWGNFKDQGAAVGGEDVDLLGLGCTSVTSTLGQGYKKLLLCPAKHYSTFQNCKALLSLHWKKPSQCIAAAHLTWGVGGCLFVHSMTAVLGNMGISPGC